MSRVKKDGTKVTYYLETALIEALEKFCDKTGRTKTKVMEIALKEYLEKHKDDA